jgi:hypothetical protein
MSKKVTQTKTRMISNIRAIRVGSEVRISMRVSAARMLHRRSRAQRDQERREALRRNHENIRTQKSNGTIYQPFLCDVELKRGFVFPKVCLNFINFVGKSARRSFASKSKRHIFLIYNFSLSYDLMETCIPSKSLVLTTKFATNALAMAKP